MKNYAQCMTDEELVRELKSRAVDQRTAAEQAVRDDLHCNPSAGFTCEDLAALLDESAVRLGHQSHQPTVKENLWKPDLYAGPQGESIHGEGVKLEVWIRQEPMWRWSVTWFSNYYEGEAAR